MTMSATDVRARQDELYPLVPVGLGLLQSGRLRLFP
jgi:hypothetical protein